MNLNMTFKKIAIASLLVLVSFPLGAGQLSLGFFYDGWNSNYLTSQTQIATNNGYEFWVPLALSLNLANGTQVYGQGLFGNASYNYSQDGIANTAQNLKNLGDSIVGGEVQFKSFGYSSLLNVNLNLPTGDSTWEAKQYPAIIPTQFMDYRYRGRGFGVNALYALSLPVGKNSLGIGAGYFHTGSYDATGDPNYSLQLGDNLFLGLNFVQPGQGGYKEIARVSCYYTLTTQVDGQDQYRLGANLNASYSWFNPYGFSLDTGAQYFLPDETPNSTNSGISTESNTYYAPRLYAAPSYSFGSLRLSGQVKYVFANNYPETVNGNINPMYFGGGWLLGAGPSWTWALDGSSSLNFFGAYDFVLQNKAALDSDGSGLANATYNYMTLGTYYQVNL
jgi:hypothetical protein